MPLSPLIRAVVVLGFLGSPWAADSLASSDKNSERPIYEYAGPDGTRVFTDDRSRIPAEYQNSVKIVELPQAIKMPEPTPPVKPEPPSMLTRIREWFQSQPYETRVVFVGILPVMALSIGVMSFLRRRVESVFVKTALRFGMLAVLVLSAYLGYSILMRAQAGRLIGDAPGGRDILTSPRQKAVDLKKDEADRLKTIEGIANHN